MILINHIIANPPYEFGNAITTTVLNNVDFDDYVNLMPVSKYKKGKIYQHIVPNSLKKVQWTGDASTNPQIAVLTKTRNAKVTENDFGIWSWDPKYKKYYEENLKRAVPFTKKFTVPKYTDLPLLNPKTDFQITTRTVTDGVHRTQNCYDYKWNVLFDSQAYSKDEHYQRSMSNYYRFTEIEKTNLTKWWYSSKICSNLIWGLNQQTGDCIEIIPRVDWSKEWTDEEILKDYGYTDEEIEKLLE